MNGSPLKIRNYAKSVTKQLSGDEIRYGSGHQIFCNFFHQAIFT